MMTVYRIPDWDIHFENNKSRDIEECSFVAMPNKQHGMGLTRILAQADGGAIFGIWCLILQAASRQKRPRAGWLTDDGTPEGNPWDIEDMALRWRRPVDEVRRALDVLCSPKVGWLTVCDEVPPKCPSGAGEVPPGCRPGAAQVPSNHPRTEQKGTEQKEQKGGGGDTPPPPPGPDPGEAQREANRKALRKELLKLALPASAEAVEAWSAALQGAGAASLLEAIESLRWVIRKAREGNCECDWPRKVPGLLGEVAAVIVRQRERERREAQPGAA